MSEIIPIAKQSPRISNGIIAWYVGDAFIIDWSVHLTEDEEPVIFTEGDKLEWHFYSMSNKNTPIHTFTFNYQDMHDNTVTLFFSSEISSKFAIGTYTYCVKFLSHTGRIVTLNANNRIKVEACH